MTMCGTGTGTGTGTSGLTLLNGYMFDKRPVGSVRVMLPDSG